MGLRKTLLVSQFTLSLIFILSVIVMYDQLRLFVSSDYGFNMKENIMIKLNNTSAPALKTELLKFPNIKSVAGASHIPAAGTTHGNGFKRQLSESEWTNINTFWVDEDYIGNLEVDIVSGKFYQAEIGEGNKNFVVINEEAVKALRFATPQDALGHEIIAQYDSSRMVIIGVVKNYNHNQLFRKIDPLALLYSTDQISLLQVRYSGSRDQASRSIEKAWTAVNPALKIDYKDVEEEIKLFYNTVLGDLVSVLGVVAALAIMISCLGLLGMATYTVESRTKEISIRKVLGSSDQALIMLLSKGFLKILIISIAIGVPAAWFLNNLWLELIAYHTELGLSTALLGITVLLILGIITIGSQTLRAAFTNPVDNLKNE
jgi:putative ABC transport system permease protein